MYRILLDVQQAQPARPDKSKFVQKVVSPPLEHGKLPSELRIDIGVKVKDQPDQGLHIIFCLDESGSMGGQPWNELIRALSQFWNTRGAEQVPTPPRVMDPMLYAPH